MELKKLKGKSYQLINSGGARYQIRSTRPVRKTSDYTIKYWKTYYQLILQNHEDVTNFRKGILKEEDDNRGVWTDEVNTLGYISKTYFEGKKVRQIGSGFGIYSEDCNGLPYRTKEIIIALLIDEEAEDITKPTPTEKRLWAAQKERDDNTKLVKAYFGPNVQELAKQYHLSFCEYGDGTIGLDFNSQPDIAEFFKTAINELIMSKLNVLGLKGTMNEKVITKGLNKAWMYEPVVDNLKINETALQ